MKKIIPVLLILASLSGCSILSELTALSRCEYKFHSAQDPVIAGIDMTRVRDYSDLTFMDAQRVGASIIQKRLPFGITANVEVYNPGPVKAAVNYIDWIAFIDEVQVATGRIERRIEIAPNGGTSIIPVRIETDLFDYLEGDSPKTMLNFGLNLIDAGGQPTRLSMKIKPSVYIGGTLIPAPDYFTISKEFKSGE